MTRKRFKNLVQYIHLNDNTMMKPRGDPGYDPLHKIRPLYSHVQATIKDAYNPGMNLTIDEAMVAYKGRSFMKQYGVDLADQNLSYYDMGRDAKKFWKCLMWYMINTCVVNSYVIYKQTMLAAGKHPIRHLAFRQKLITQLIGGFSNRKRAGRIWLYHCLTNRSHFLRLPGGISNDHPVISGVPQGTVLGPLHFLIMIADIDKGVTESNQLRG